MSSSRKVPYFFNSETKKSVWDTPDGLTKDQVEALPGAEYLHRPAQVRASHLLVKHAGSRNPSSWKEVRRNLDLCSIYYLSWKRARKTSLDPKQKLSRSFVGINPRWTALSKSSQNSLESTPIAARLTRVVISGCLDLDRCRNHSRMRLLG
jgi:hypothetical protein